MISSRESRRTLALALLAYVPALVSAPGRVPGDTKLSLYLDPGRLIADSIWTWDSRQFSGWVPHQNVGYLWPSGPFYWFFDMLGVPDWVAHRLWIGTLLFVAGTGMAFFTRRLGSPPTAVLVAALVYQTTPFVLPYVSRTSALLLPWSLLGWILGVTVLVVRHRRARDVAVWTLLVASTGGLNATALAMIAPAPLVWVLAESRGRRWRSTVGLLGGLGAAAVAANAWWIGGLVTQGRHGAPVLSYSETLPSTAATSTSIEVLRGLGYWLFYDRNVAVELTSAAEPYMGFGVVMVAGLLLVAIGLIGVGLLPPTTRRPTATVLVIGVVLAVGAHPFADPSPLWSWAADDPTSAISLALRSSTRAAPLIVLALALGAGAVAEWSRQRLVARGQRSSLATLVICGLAVINMPVLLTGRLVDPVLERPNEIPSAWTDAAQFLDQHLADGHDGAVLLLPGIESAAYRWGYPVDPVLPALTDKRFVSRDWLPLGSAPYMDVLYALDDAFQEGRLDPAAVAPIARLLGADTVMVVNSHQDERFGTVRAERAARLLGDDPPGLRRLATFGEPAADPPSRFWSPDEIVAPSRPLPEIELWSVDEPAPAVRVSETPSWVRADGTGLVDAAAAGAIDGREVVLDPATFDRTGRNDAISPSSVVVTDANRRRAHHWRSSQEVWGATEPESGVVSVTDVHDQRLALTSFTAAETIIRAESIEAVATGYGTELSYWPEYRPSMALDGDTDTAWLVGDERDPRGHVLTLTSQVPLSSLELERSTGRDRWITAVDVRSDDGDWMRHELDDSTTVELSAPARRVDVRIAAIAWDDDAGPGIGSAVGFVEVLPVDLRRPEVVRIPAVPGDPTIATFVFTRLVADPIDDWRADPEVRLVREFDTSATSMTDVSISARLSSRARTAVVSDLLGLDPSTSRHLLGRQSWASWSAHDGDRSSTWWSAVGDDRPALTVPISGSVDEIRLVQPESSPRVRRVAISNGSGPDREFPVAPDGRVAIDPTDDGVLEIVVVDFEERTALDRRTGRIVRRPLGVSEVEGASSIRLDVEWTTGCRDDLLRIDATPVPVRVSGRIDRLLAGEPAAVETCGSPVSLVAGTHLLETSSGLDTGIDIDRVVLSSSEPRPSTVATPVDVDTSRAGRRFTVPPCARPCVVEGFDGWNDGWTGDPEPSAAGRNTWILEPSSTAREISTTWRPQRIMWVGLAVSAATIFGAAIVVLITTRRRSRTSDVVAASTGPITVDTDRGSLAAGLGTVAVVALTVAPVWGLVPLALMVAARFSRRRISSLVEPVGLTLVLLGLLFVVAQQIRTGADPGFGWPSVFARAHRPVLAGLVMWGISLATRATPDSLRPS